MEFEAPSWLNKEFIKDALQGGKVVEDDDSIIVDSVELEKPVAKGDNYVSDLFRATVKYRKQNENTQLNTSLIIKVPKTGGMAEYLLKTGIMQKEVRIYTDYLPKLNNIFGADKTLTPKLIHSNSELVLVLEDLKLKGYVMANRRDQLDYEHCVLALKTLASFHAASVRIHEDEPELVEAVGKESFFSELMEMNKQFAGFNFKIMANELKDDPKLGRYADQLLGYGENCWDIMVEMVKPKPESINVLNHGDFWVNNLLFRYDQNKKPIDLKLIDLQISRYARPSLDLLYFFFGSVQEDVRIHKLDELLKIYVDELNAYLEKFGTSQRITEPELKSMVDDCEFFGFFVTLSLFPIIIADPKEGVMEVSEITEEQLANFASQETLDNNPFKGYYRSEKFRSVLADRFAEFEKKGWF